MSTQYQKIKSKFTDGFKSPIFIPTIVLILIAIIGISSFFIGKNINSDSNSPIPVISLQKVSNLTDDNQKILGETINNWAGKIINIKKQQIQIVVDVKQPDGSVNQKTINVKLADNTIINQWDISKPPAASEVQSNYKVISLDDLKINQSVMVKSNNDINQDSEIIATEINLIITP